jgi:hypothetical protein
VPVDAVQQALLAPGQSITEFGLGEQTKLDMRLKDPSLDILVGLDNVRKALGMSSTAPSTKVVAARVAALG